MGGDCRIGKKKNQDFKFSLDLKVNLSKSVGCLKGAVQLFASRLHCKGGVASDLVSLQAYWGWPVKELAWDWNHCGIYCNGKFWTEKKKEAINVEEMTLIIGGKNNTHYLLSNLQVQYMYLFNMPKNVTHRLDRIRRNFLWDGQCQMPWKCLVTFKPRFPRGQCQMVWVFS